MKQSSPTREAGPRAVVVAQRSPPSLGVAGWPGMITGGGRYYWGVGPTRAWAGALASNAVVQVASSSARQRGGGANAPPITPFSSSQTAARLLTVMQVASGLSAAWRGARAVLRRRCALHSANTRVPRDDAWADAPRADDSTPCTRCPRMGAARAVAGSSARSWSQATTSLMSPPPRHRRRNRRGRRPMHRRTHDIFMA